MPFFCVSLCLYARMRVLGLLVSGVWMHGEQWEPSNWHHSWCNPLAWALMVPPTGLTGSADEVFWMTWKGESADWVCSCVHSRMCLSIEVIVLRSSAAYLFNLFHMEDPDELSLLNQLGELLLDFMRTICLQLVHCRYNRTKALKSETYYLLITYYLHLFSQ